MMIQVARSCLIARSCIWPLRNVSIINLSPGHNECGTLKTWMNIQQRGKAKIATNKRNLINKFVKDKAKKDARRYVEVWLRMSVRDFARAMKVPVDDVFELVLKTEGADYIEDDRQAINNTKIFDKIGKQLDWHCKFVSDPKTKLKKNADENHNLVITPPKPEDMKPRPPVVAIMGHIDHGKTTLLDYLRKSRIVAGEYGGITQHIGAFSVTLEGGKEVTFIDTPGHAAFKAMRSRGAYATDIVVLMVDAAEGVLEQTLESIRMIKEAGTSMIVAVNKIDRPNANIENTKLELKEAGVMLEEFGGDIQVVPISALKGTNVDLLVEALAAQAEVLQLMADYKGQVEGIVIESKQDGGLGKIATVLVQRGILKKGQILICGKTSCRVRRLMDDKGEDMVSVKPSQAAQVVGWKDVPSAGDTVNEVANEKKASEVIKWREREEKSIKESFAAEEIERMRQKERAEYSSYRMKKLEAGVMKPRYGRYDFHTRHKEVQEDPGEAKLCLVIKADVDGSLEAILNCLETYDDDNVKLDILDFGVGAVNDNDLVMAKEFGGMLYLFNTSISDARRKTAAEMDVEVKEFNIIYKLIDELKEDVSARLPLLDVDDTMGQAKVLQEFLINEKRHKVPVAGCRVQSGPFEVSNSVKVLRNGKEVFRGSITSLKHIKEEVTSLEAGKECGIRVSDSEFRFEVDDLIVNFIPRREKQFTKWDPGF